MTSSLRTLSAVFLALALAAGLLAGRLVHSTDPRQTGDIPTTVPTITGPTLPGGAVYPAQSIPIRFDHGQHLALGLDCTRCHTEIRASTRASELNFPKGQVCDDCHGAQHPRPRGEPARCRTCHTRVSQGRVTAALDAPAPLLHFNHKLHLAKGAKCADCHRNMKKVRLATTLQLPSEADCLRCHDGIAATDRCAACHPSRRTGKLVTRARDDRVSPRLVPRGRSGWGAAHDLAFVEDHAGVAKANPRLCAECHGDTFCTDCHAGTVRPMRIHSGDFINTHALDARARTQDCQSCHRVQTFCRACHDRLGFGSRDADSYGVGSSIRFHPAGWSGPPGMPQGHAHPAQRNMLACASCHDEDSCMACHATTSAATPGLNVNPHGPSFVSSARCQTLATRNHRVCLKCHAPGDPNNDCLQ